jgi:hypothetical protein
MVAREDPIVSKAWLDAKDESFRDDRGTGNGSGPRVTIFWALKWLSEHNGESIVPPGRHHYCWNHTPFAPADGATFIESLPPSSADRPGQNPKDSWVEFLYAFGVLPRSPAMSARSTLTALQVPVPSIRRRYSMHSPGNVADPDIAVTGKRRTPSAKHQANFCHQLPAAI